MKTINLKFYRLSCIFLLLLINSNLFSQTTRYKWKYNTITHKLLQIEELNEASTKIVTQDFDNKYLLLDNIIDNCKKSVSNIDLTTINDEIQAKKVLKIIDSTLSKNLFTVCVKIENLSDALTLKSKGTLNCMYTNDISPIDYRVRDFSLSKKFYHVDCDLFSFIYLGIGEALGIPVSFIEVPNHNFIRWNLSDNTFINWDVNMGKTYLNNEYKTGIPYLTSGFSDLEETKYHYLNNLNNNEVLGYYYFVIGRLQKKNQKYKNAENLYLKSIQYRPSSPIAKYCLAYMIVFTGAYNSSNDFLLASRLAKEAYDIDNDHKEIVETYACSLALLSRFEEAKKVLKSYKKYDPDLYNAFEKNNNGIEIYQKKHHSDVFN